MYRPITQGNDILTYLQTGWIFRQRDPGGGRRGGDPICEAEEREDDGRRVRAVRLGGRGLQGPGQAQRIPRQ